MKSYLLCESCKDPSPKISVSIMGDSTTPRMHQAAYRAGWRLVQGEGRHAQINRWYCPKCLPKRLLLRGPPRAFWGPRAEFGSCLSCGGPPAPESRVLSIQMLGIQIQLCDKCVEHLENQIHSPHEDENKGPHEDPAPETP